MPLARFSKLITSRNQGGGDKKQGFPPSMGLGTFAMNAIRIRAWGYLRDTIIPPTTFSATITTPSNSFTLRMPYDAVDSRGIYDGTIYWGDGTTSPNVKNAEHIYLLAGNYTITIDGVINGWYTYSNGTMYQCLITINRFGPKFSFGTFASDTNGAGGMFRNCSLLKTISSDIPTSNVKTMVFMFNGCANFNQELDFNTSNVVFMGSMFNGCTNFNSTLKFNDTSKVENMSYMFYGCTKFNKPLDFNTSKVLNMQAMFTGCAKFNQPLPFDTSLVTYMDYMFSGCSIFSQNLSGWCVEDIASLPLGFNTNAPGLTVSNLPKWGEVCTP
uniref:PKD domain-containing protein n=1 Tax=viral metagenome TaxID=1070528 RepID=A0A6C0HP45_9ZZZZ